MAAVPSALPAEAAADRRVWLYQWVDRLLPWLVLALLLFYMVQWLFIYPYAGFRNSAVRGVVDHIYVPGNGALETGDRLLVVNGLPYAAFQADYRQELFRGLQPGDSIPVVLVRGAETLTVEWVIPGPTRREIEGRLTNQWWIAFTFWLAGLVVWLSVRPRDKRRMLLMLFNFVTAIWFLNGVFANWHFAGGMFTFKIAMWFVLPIYLQLHWNFPTSLGPLPRGIWVALYGGAATMGILELLQWVPQNLHFLSFFAGAGGSVLMVSWRYWRRPAERPYIAPIGLALAMGTLVPLLGVIPLLLNLPIPSYVAGGTLMTLAALPGAYVYGILLQQAGERAPRLRRLLPIYLVLVVSGVLLIAAVVLFTGLLRQTPPAIASGLPLLFTGLAIVLVSFVPFVSLAAMASALQTPLAADQLGFRANRLFAPFLFGLLLVVAILFFAVLLTGLLPYTGSAILVGLASAGLTALLVGQFYQPFARLIDRRLLRIPYIARETQQRFAARISANLTRAGLAQLLTNELLPALLIRQSALLLLPSQDLRRKMDTCCVFGLEIWQLPADADLAWLRDSGGTAAPRPELQWVRHLFYLRISGDLIGVWLLGAREPDNYYSEPELESLQLIADQLAIAVMHITQGELLRDLYSAHIDQEEVARRYLASELHDEVLSRLAALRMYADDGAVPPQFDVAFDALTRRIRQTISDLRPALLTYGLAAALEELTESLRQRVGDRPLILLDISGDSYRLPKRIEEHLFRIVQQAAENALQHAQAGEIQIRATFASQQVLLEVVDDGRGIDFTVLDQLPQLVRDQHFGLAGMVERAALIGAPIAIGSITPQGTRMRLTWRPATAA